MLKTIIVLLALLAPCVGFPIPRGPTSYRNKSLLIRDSSTVATRLPVTCRSSSALVKVSQAWQNPIQLAFKWLGWGEKEENTTIVRDVELQKLGQGLVKASNMFGWSLTDNDALQLEHLQKEIMSVTGYLTNLEREVVKVATEFAFHAHHGQLRKSGEPFVIHPVAVGSILANLRMDCDTVVAGLLHDTVEDTCLAFADLEENFGVTVRRIVEGETKVSKVTGNIPGYTDAGIASDTGARVDDKQAANLRHMLVAMSDDWRVIVVKLADRLHNMRTIGSMPPHKQVRIARETMDVFVPLAHRLGFGDIRAELEDLSLKILEPDNYSFMVGLIKDYYMPLVSCSENLDVQAEHLASQLSSRLQLPNHDPYLTVSVVAKSVTGVWRAYQEKKNDFTQVHDVFSIKIVVSQKDKLGMDRGNDVARQKDIELCYRALDAVHAVLQPTTPPCVKDYIAFPKTNGYRSVHTTVCILGFPIEVQIKTAEMDRVARFGMAADWKERSAQGQSKKLPWLRDVARGADGRTLNSSDPSLLYTTCVREELNTERKFVFAQGGTIMRLGQQATVGDAAAKIELGRCADGQERKIVGVKVNSCLVGLNHKLRHGDVVAVITAPSNPADDEFTEEDITTYIRPNLYTLTDTDANTASAIEGSMNNDNSQDTYKGSESIFSSKSHINNKITTGEGVDFLAGELRGPKLRLKLNTPPKAVVLNKWTSKNKAALDAASGVNSKLGTDWKVHMLLNQGVGVWPWSLVGQEIDKTDPACGPCNDRRRINASNSDIDKNDDSNDDGSGGAGSMQFNSVEYDKRDAGDREDSRAEVDFGEFRQIQQSSDIMWYMEAELKHGRLSLFALMWAALRGSRAMENILNGSLTGAQIHQNPLAHVYFVTPVQCLEAVVIVGICEAVYSLHQTYISSKGYKEGPDSPIDTDISTASYGSEGFNAALTRRETSSGKTELGAGRMAMLALVALLVHSVLSNEDTISQIMGLF